MRFSRTGLALGAVYLAGAVPLLIMGYTSTGDIKGAFVLKQLAVMPGVLLIGALQGLGLDLEPLLDMPWLNNFPAVFLLSLALMYGLGWLLGGMVTRLSGTPPSQPVERP